jgi:hypothetical protein
MYLISFQYQFFHKFFTWIALGDVDLHFSLMLLRKASAVEGETRLAA